MASDNQFFSLTVSSDSKSALGLLRENINRRTRRANDLQVNIKTLSSVVESERQKIRGKNISSSRRETISSGITNRQRILTSTRLDLAGLRVNHKQSNIVAKKGLTNAKKRLTRTKKLGVSSRIAVVQKQVDAQIERVRIIASGNKRIFGPINTIRKKRSSARFGSVLTTNRLGA